MINVWFGCRELTSPCTRYTHTYVRSQMATQREEVENGFSGDGNFVVAKMGVYVCSTNIQERYAHHRQPFGIQIGHSHRKKQPRQHHITSTRIYSGTFSIIHYSPVIFHLLLFPLCIGEDKICCLLASFPARSFSLSLSLSVSPFLSRRSAAVSR